MKKISTLFLAIIDMLFLIVLFFIISSIRLKIDNTFFQEFQAIHIKDFYFVLLILFALLYNEKIYRHRYDFWQETLKIIKSFFIGFILVLALLTLTKTNLEYSRSFIILYFVFGALLFPVMKRYTKKFFFSFDVFKKRVLLLGTLDQVKLFGKEFKDNWYLGQKQVSSNYDAVVLLSKGMDIKELTSLTNSYLHEKCELFVVPYITDINFAHSNIMEYSNIRYNTIEVENKLLVKQNIWIKNLFDKMGVLLILPFFSIIHIVISLSIKFTSKGNVFFKQHRLGKNNVDFVCYKYRTMYEDSSGLLDEYLKKNPDEVKYYEKFHKYKNDPRITKVGKLLRSTSLDELPQIINVLKGEMSLVGPRPYMLSESEKLGKHQEYILKVHPGITGLWQVSGRNELTFKERNDLELWYIHNWSLWADFVIMVKTIKVVLLKVGAR